MSEYDKIRKRKCEWCAKGIPLELSIGGIERHYSDDTDINDKGKRCTAPSPLAVIDRQAEEIRGLQEVLREAANHLYTLQDASRVRELARASLNPNLQTEAALAIRGRRRPKDKPTISRAEMKQASKELAADAMGENGNG